MRVGTAAAVVGRAEQHPRSTGSQTCVWLGAITSALESLQHSLDISRPLGLQLENGAAPDRRGWDGALRRGLAARAGSPNEATARTCNQPRERRCSVRAALEAVKNGLRITGPILREFKHRPKSRRAARRRRTKKNPAVAQKEACVRIHPILAAKKAVDRRSCIGRCTRHKFEHSAASNGTSRSTAAALRRPVEHSVPICDDTRQRPASALRTGERREDDLVVRIALHDHANACPYNPY